MKPETSSQNPTPEQLPSRGVSGVDKMSKFESSETGSEKGVEAFDRKSEVNAIRADIGLTTVLPTPVIGATTATDDTADDISLSNNPAVANDDDLIEKEWVDKAKKIVAETQDDPHKRDEQVNKLQVDYLKKRFGRELGAAE